jgi:NAD(P)H-hydrate epimerase
VSQVFVFDRAALREVDRRATEEFGIPSIVLMENAAIHVAAATLDRLGKRRHRGVLIACGKGNNGGDGLAAARHLHNAGVPVSLVLAAETWEYPGDAGLNAQTVLRMGLHMHLASPAGVRDAFEKAWNEVGEPAAIIDALLGTGPEKMIQPGAVVAHMVEAINAMRVRAGPDCQVISVDAPSGLDCDAGRPLVRRGDGTTTAVRADFTISMVGWKTGFSAASAQRFLGEVMIADIGAPVELTSRLGRPLALGGPRNGAPGANPRVGTGTRGAAGAHPVKPTRPRGTPRRKP